MFNENLVPHYPFLGPTLKPLPRNFFFISMTLRILGYLKDHARIRTRSNCSIALCVLGSY